MRANSRRFLGILSTVLGGMLLATLLATPALAVEMIYKGEIMARAWSARGTLYEIDTGDNVHIKSYRPDTVYADEPKIDCSGFLQKVWQVPADMYPGEWPSTEIETSRFKSPQAGDGWSITDSSLDQGTSLVRTDAMVYNDGSGGHIVMYVSNSYPWLIIDASPANQNGGVDVRNWPQTSYPWTSLSIWRAIRRDSVRDYSLGIELDNTDAYQANGTAPKYYIPYSGHTCYHFGDWQKSSQSALRYGMDYQHEWGTDSGVNKLIRWTPHLSQTGYYLVKMRWPANDTYATNAQVQIRNAYGISTAWVDQTQDGGTWVTLGRYYFYASYNWGTGSVAITTLGSPTNRHVIADAVRFEYNP